MALTENTKNPKPNYQIKLDIQPHLLVISRVYLNSIPFELK